MISFGMLREVKPGDEIAGEFLNHLYIMRVDHVVYTIMDVNGEVEKYLRDNKLTEPKMVRSEDRTPRQIELGSGKWDWSEVSSGTVLLIGHRADMRNGEKIWESFHGYMHQNDLVMINRPEEKD